MPAVMAFLLPIILAAGQWIKIQTPLNWNFNPEKKLVFKHKVIIGGDLTDEQISAIKTVLIIKPI
jgi:hypothetical protein